MREINMYCFDQEMKRNYKRAIKKDTAKRVTHTDETIL